jgi:tetratricopeptide (TPR) repeat protein
MFVPGGKVGMKNSQIIFLLLRFIYSFKRRLKAYYKIIWKKASALQPRDVMDIRGDRAYGYSDFYLERPTDQIIRQKLIDGQSILVLEHPLAGKTRAIFQALKTCSKPLGIIIPKIIDIDPEDLHVPLRLAFWRTPVLLLDDLDKYLEKETMISLIQEFIRAGIMIVATCRQGLELQKVGHVLEREMVLFGDPVQISKIDRDSGRAIARQVGQDLPVSFDGNIGSILLPLDTMKVRFQAANEIEKAILRGLKRLYMAGIYREREMFDLPRVQEVCRRMEGLERQPYQWREAFEHLRNQDLVEIPSGEDLRVEEAYLEKVVEPEFQSLDNLRQMLGVFAGDPEALFYIGKKAYELGLVDLNKGKYLRLAIAAYKAALTVYTRERFAMDYSMLQNSLGNSYRILAEVEHKAANSKKAIKAYEAALTVRTKGLFPVQYAMTKDNLGCAYAILAQVENQAANCCRAIKAFEAALTVRTREQFPIQYAKTQISLGVAYRTLSDVEDKAANCKKAIAAYKEAMTVITLERFPMDYARIQNNLGNAYRTMAEVKLEDRAVNCRHAIQAYEVALALRTREHFPMQYANTQINLGNAYCILAAVEEKAANCKRAIQAYEASLEIYSRERFPMNYAMTQNNLGRAYQTLAEVEDKAANCRRSIEAYNAALHIFTLKEFPVDFLRISIGLEITRRFCEG